MATKVTLGTGQRILLRLRSPVAAPRISDPPHLVSLSNDLTGEALRFLTHVVDIGFARNRARVGRFFNCRRIAQCYRAHLARPAAVSPLNTIIPSDTIICPDNAGWPAGLPVDPPAGRVSDFSEFFVSQFDVSQNSLILRSQAREVRVALHGPSGSQSVCWRGIYA
jgi:hypothetical protein